MQKVSTSSIPLKHQLHQKKLKKKITDKCNNKPQKIQKKKRENNLQSISMLNISFKHFKRVLERFSHRPYIHISSSKPPRSSNRILSLDKNPENFSCFLFTKTLFLFFFWWWGWFFSEELLLLLLCSWKWSHR